MEERPEEEQQTWLELLYEEIDIGGVLISPVYLLLTVIGLITGVIAILKR